MIKSVDIVAFGKLKNFKKDFDDNIDVNYGANGAGKTTLAAFIAAMFYGLPDTRTKDLSQNLRAKYMPWGRMEKFGGSLVFEHNGETKRITREFGKTPKDDTVELRNEKNGKKIDMENLGESLFDLMYTDFVNCFFVPQDAVTLDTTDNFSKKISQMIGGENCDTAINNLDANAVVLKQKVKRNNREQGKLPEAEETVKSLTEQIKTAESKREEIETKQRKLKTLSNEEILLKNKVNENEKTLKAISDEKLKYDAQVAVAKERESQKQKSLEDLPPCADFEAIPKKIQTAEKLIPLTKQKPILSVWLIAISILTVFCGIVFGIFDNYLLLGIFMGVAVIVGLVGLLVWANHRKKIKRIDIQIKELLKPVEVIDTYGQVIDKLQNYYLSYKNINSDEIEIPKTYDDTTFEKLTSEQKILRDKIDENHREASALAKEIDILSKDIPDITELKENLINGQKQVKELRAEYEAIMLAIEGLKKAKDKLSEAYLPKMAEELKKYLSVVTNGKIEEIVVSVDNGNGSKGTDFILMPKQNGVMYDMDYFSRGEREIALFYLKMTLAKLIYGDDIPFVLVDDAFVNYGEAEFSETIKILKQISLKTQVIYFTCQNRGLQQIRNN
ncbi:MAG TPA: AAA family ATPase [Clostridia bacterium]|nr:AAA family ATPase [Clostridia bacterium]